MEPSTEPSPPTEPRQSRADALADIDAALAQSPPAHLAAYGEQVVRDGLAMVRDQLVDRRASRDALNAEIAVLVTDEETLAQAVAVFERRRKATRPSEAVATVTVSTTPASKPRRPNSTAS